MNKTNIKIWATVVSAVVVVIVVLQNTDVVDTKILFVTLSMPQAVLLFGTLVIGFLFGLLMRLRLSRTEKKKAKEK